MNSRKAIGPVVAIALLMVVAVSAVVGFQMWYQIYSTSLFTDTESKSDINSLGIENLIGNKLFLKIPVGGVNISQIKLGSDICPGDFSNLSSGIVELDLSYCLYNKSYGPEDVVVITNFGVFSKTYLIDSSFAASFCDDSLVLLMHFNNDSSYGENSSLVYDFSGTGNNGTVVNVTWIETGKFGGAFDFNETLVSVGDGRIDLGNDPSLKNSVLTYSAWVYPYTTTDGQYVFGGTTSGRFFSLEISSANSIVLKKQNFGTIGSGGFVPDYAWSHIAVSFNSSSDEYSIYQNGVQVISGTSSEELNAGFSSMIIGNMGEGQNDHFHGLIDDVAIWNRELTEDEISTIYSSGVEIQC